MAFVRPMIDLPTLGVCLLLAGAAVHADQPRVAQTDQSISVRWPELDAWRQAGQPLRATVEFHAAAVGSAPRRVELDLFDPATGHATVFSKPPGAAYQRLSLTVQRGQDRLLHVDVPLPEISGGGQAMPLLADPVVVERGADAEASDSPRVPAPDWSRVRLAKWDESIPAVELVKQRRLVSCDFNPPITYALSLVANQTAHPHDISRKSVYISATIPLFNAQSGEMESRLHFLVELPIDPQWVGEAGNTSIRMDPAAIRVHMDWRTVQIGQETMRITGERSGGLSQGQYQALVGDDGNLYFAMPYRGPLRFNVARAAFEIAPVDVVQWYTQRMREPRRRQELTEIHRDLFEPRPDIDSTLFSHQGRVYVMFGRYLRLKHGNRPEMIDLLASALISIPQGDVWYDAHAFGQDIRLQAEGFPGSTLSLYDSVPPVSDERCKIRELSGMGHQLVLWSYDYDRFWRLELDSAGQTRRILPITHLAGRRIAKFSPTAHWHHRGGQPLGIRLDVTLEGQEKPVTAFLPADADELTAQVPPTDAEVFDTGTAPVRQRRIAYARGRGYGQSGFRKSSLQPDGKTALEGSLGITWDASVAMRQAMASRQGDESSTTATLSAGPGYLLVPLPGSGTQFLGAGDYPSYYLSVYTLGSDGGVHRQHLMTGPDDEPRAVTTGLGPYATAWTRRGEGWNLWIAGYTGVLRLPWPVDGSIPARVHTQLLGTYLEDAVSLDGAKPGPIRWHNRVLPGLDGKVVVTGYNQVARGGTAHSSGVRWLAAEPEASWQSLSRLARGHHMAGLASRLRIDADGKSNLDVLAVGSPDKASTLTLSDETKPNPIQSRMFVMSDRGDRLLDRFSLTLAAAGDAIVTAEDVAISASGLHGLLLTGEGVLLSLDLDSWRFTDAVRLPGRALTSDRAPTLVPLAHGDHALFISGGSAFEAMLLHVHVATSGEIQVRPLAKLALDRPEALKGARAVVGSTLVLGPPAMREDATLTVLPNILIPHAP